MKQITEDYCSYEIAKLLKEKGFDEYCGTAYTTAEGYPIRVMGSTYSLERNSDYDNLHYSMPSQSLALKWLREVHKIVLDIAFETNKGWTFYVSHLITETLSDGSTYIVNIQHSVWSDDVQQPYYKEYEQTVEAAILYVLKNLI